MDNKGVLGPKEKEKIAHSLRKFLAGTYVLYTKTQIFHWNVVGKEFYALHLLFEKQYQDLAEALDEIAERIRALNERVEGSLAIFKHQSSVEEEKEFDLTAHQMCKKLIESHEVLVNETRLALKMIEDLGDGATVDMVGRRLLSHEKMMWMLSSQL